MTARSLFREGLNTYSNTCANEAAYTARNIDDSELSIKALMIVFEILTESRKLSEAVMLSSSLQQTDILDQAIARTISKLENTDYPPNIDNLIEF